MRGLLVGRSVGGHWTDSEIEFLKQNYAVGSRASLVTGLNGRLWHSVLVKASDLGLRRLYRTSRASVDDLYFSIPVVENSYWAGYIAADGCVISNRPVVTINIKRSDSEHLEKFARCVHYAGKIHYGFARPQWGGLWPMADIQVTSRQWVSDLLNNFRITPRKSKTLCPPSLVGGPRLAFICGYIDGDGSIGYRRRNGDLFLAVRGTWEVLSWLKHVFDSLVPAYRIHGRDYGCAGVTVSGGICQYMVNGGRAERILHELSCLPVPRLERKWRRVGTCA